jgi:hypothetical protein
MRMTKHRLELLALLTAFAVAPAIAGNRIDSAAGVRADEVACPYERARLAAVAQSRAEQAPAGLTRVTLTQGIARGGAVRGVANRSFLNP